MGSSKRSEGLSSLIGNHTDFLLIKLHVAKFILGKVKLEPITLSGTCTAEVPLYVQGLFTSLP